MIISNIGSQEYKKDFDFDFDFLIFIFSYVTKSSQIILWTITISATSQN
jgi:hypothetical protein